MLSNLISSINDNIYASLDKLVFITPDVTNSLETIMGTNSYSGINLICNSLIYGFLLYYGISYLLSHLTFSQVERPFQFVFKLLLCTFAINGSLAICSGLVMAASHISNLICELGNYCLGVNVSFSSLLNNILPKEYFTTNAFSLFSFDRLLKSLY